MTYSIDNITDRIVRHHTTFAGHRVSRSGIRVWDTLMRAAEFLRQDASVVSVSFDAELTDFAPDANGLLSPIKTIITIGANGDGTYSYCEDIAV